MQQQPIYQKKPTFINLNITHKCNFKCLHCSIGQRPFYETPTYELNFDSLKKHVLGFKKWLKDFELQISGGEPLLYPYFFEFLDFCSTHDINVAVPTNGWLFTRENIIRLANTRLTHLDVSIDGMSSTHDFIRQKRRHLLGF